MRYVVVAIMLSCFVAVPVHAQDPDEGTRSLTKIIIGAGAIAIGATVAAKSSQTTTVSTTSGTAETSSFSTSQLVTGLAVAGVGGIILWDGLRSHQPSRPSTTIGATVAKGVHGVFVRRAW